MKRNEIVEKLIKEGFSEKTLVKFTDKQLTDLSSRILGEADVMISNKDPKKPEKVKMAKQMGQSIEFYEEKPSVELSKEKKSKVVKKSKSIKKENTEVKTWLETIAEDNFHSFTSKNEIMELIQTKLNEVEVGPGVKKGHNGIPEFMSYDMISNAEVKEAGPITKPTPTKPKVEPGTKPKTPWSPKPGEKSKPKALKEKKDANK